MAKCVDTKYVDILRELIYLLSLESFIEVLNSVLHFDWKVKYLKYCTWMKFGHVPTTVIFKLDSLQLLKNTNFRLTKRIIVFYSFIYGSLIYMIPG